MYYFYNVKKSLGSTTYVEFKKDDDKEIKDLLQKTLALIADFDNKVGEDNYTIKVHLHKGSRNLPHSKEGQNSPSSFLGGVVLNTVYGTQRQFTLKQLETIEVIFEALSEFLDVPSIKFRKKEQ